MRGQTVLCHLFSCLCGLAAGAFCYFLYLLLAQPLTSMLWPVTQLKIHRAPAWDAMMILAGALVSIHNTVKDSNCDCNCYSSPPPQNPVQEWGDEFEDGAVYGITLRREPVPCSPNPNETTNPSCGFVQYRTSKVRRLKAATLDLLVSHLLDPTCQEQDYGRIFLSTYRTFTSISTLIELLFHRYDSDVSKQCWMSWLGSVKRCAFEILYYPIIKHAVTLFVLLYATILPIFFLSGSWMRF